MTDVILAWDPGSLRADLSLAQGDIAVDSGLQTAVIVSLFTDRLAAADDRLPTDDGNRRGWWGDLGLAMAAAPDQIGSRLWLLTREKATEATRQRAMAYIREALQWLIDDGIAARVDLATAWGGIDRLDIAVTISRQVAGGGIVDHRFDLAWSLA